MHRALACALILLAAAPAAADCEVQGVGSLGRLRVRVPGRRIRTFTVTDLPIGVRPGRGTRYRDVRVLAPIAFGARTDADVPWTVLRPVAVADGMLWLTPRVEIEDVREQLDEEGLVIRAQLDAGVWVDRLHLPCDTITIGHGEGGVDEPAWTAQGPQWMLRRGYAWVVSRPDDEDAVSMRIDAPEGLRGPLTEMARRGDWVRVMGRFASGALLRGWMRQHDLRTSNVEETSPQPYARAMVANTPGQCSLPRPVRNEYVGPARITVGALVRLEPDGEPWATVSEPAVITVSWREGEDWVRIVYVAGLRGDGRCAEVVQDAWVPRIAVSLQGESTQLVSVPDSQLGVP